MLSHYKDQVRGVADPMARVLWRAHLRPNHLTVAGLGVSGLAAWAFATGYLRTAALLLALAGLLDLLDGALARLAGQESRFGAFLDSVVDRYSDLAVLVGILLFFQRAGDPRGSLWTMALVVGTVMVSYTKARAQSVGVTCDVGLMERPERIIGLVAGALLDVLLPAVAVLAVLTNVTALHRVAHTRRQARAGEPLVGPAARPRS